MASWKIAFIGSLVFASFVLLASQVRAVTFIKGASLSGSSFRVLDPQHAGFKASASSANYRLFSTIGDVAIGSSSATSFGLRSGFLYYPLVIQPTLTAATAGDGQVALTWTAATMDAGFTLSGYNVCSRPSAGSFTCSDVGNILSHTVTGLANGTTYVFKVQAKEAFGNVIAESEALSATPESSGGGGGGGGGSGSVIQRGFDVRGYAHPDSRVFILRDGVLIDEVAADDDAEFRYEDDDLAAGSYTFGFRAEDIDGRSSSILNIPVTVSGSGASVRNVIITPTIALVGANEIDAGTPIDVIGRAVPDSTVRVRLDPGRTEFTTRSDDDGGYTLSIDTGELTDGVYEVRARVEVSGVGVSNYSQVLPVGIGVSAPALPGICGNQPDINGDTRVNLVDFSVLAFWWRRTPLPADRPFDLNCDDRVALDDFSILAFHWTG